MKITFKLLALFGLFFIFHHLSSQEWISTNGGMIYYYGYQPEPPAENINPPNSTETITGYEVIEEISVDSFEGIVSVIGDANHNGLPEIYIPTFNVISNYYEIKVYEFDENLNYTLTVLAINGWIWDIGDINNNGLIDIIVQAGDVEPGTNGYLQIWESLDQFSFPTEKIADITLPNKKGFYFAKYQDLDEDGKKEVLMSANSMDGSNKNIRVYEWETNNLDLIWYSGPKVYPILDQAVGDFDEDNNIEILITQNGTSISYAESYECIGDNSFDYETTFDLPKKGTPKPLAFNSDR